MQLRYRGITYQPTNPQIDTIPSAIRAQFLGKTYFVRCPIKTLKPQLGLKKYRGIPYEN